MHSFVPLRSLDGFSCTSGIFSSFERLPPVKKRKQILFINLRHHETSQVNIHSFTVGFFCSCILLTRFAFIFLLLLWYIIDNWRTGSKAVYNDAYTSLHCFVKKGNDQTEFTI